MLGHPILGCHFAQIPAVGHCPAGDIAIGDNANQVAMVCDLL